MYILRVVQPSPLFQTVFSSPPIRNLACIFPFGYFYVFCHINVRLKQMATATFANPQRELLVAVHRLLIAAAPLVEHGLSGHASSVVAGTTGSSCSVACVESSQTRDWNLSPALAGRCLSIHHQGSQKGFTGEVQNLSFFCHCIFCVSYLRNII